MKNIILIYFDIVFIMCHYKMEKRWKGKYKITSVIEINVYLIVYQKLFLSL